jgi:hypothetical protein
VYEKRHLFVALGHSEAKEHPFDDEDDEMDALDDAEALATPLMPKIFFGQKFFSDHRKLIGRVHEIMQTHEGETLALNVNTKQDYHDWLPQMFPEALRIVPGWPSTVGWIYSQHSVWGLVQHLEHMHDALEHAVQGKAWNPHTQAYQQAQPGVRIVGLQPSLQIPSTLREWRALRKAVESSSSTISPFLSASVNTVCDVALFLLQWWKEDGYAKFQPHSSFKDHRDILVEVFSLWTLEHIPHIQPDLQGICELWDRHKEAFQDLRVDRGGCSKLQRAVYEGRLDKVKRYVLNEHALAWKNKLKWNSLTLLNNLGDEAERMKIYEDTDIPTNWKPPILYTDNEDLWDTTASGDLKAPMENFDSIRWALFRKHFSEMQTLLKDALDGKSAADLRIQLEQQASGTSEAKLTASKLEEIARTRPSQPRDEGEALHVRVPELHIGDEDAVSCYYSTYSKEQSSSYGSLSIGTTKIYFLTDRDTDVVPETQSGLFPQYLDQEKKLQQYMSDIVHLKQAFDDRNEFFFRIAFLCIPKDDYVDWEKSVDSTLFLDPLHSASQQAMEGKGSSKPSAMLFNAVTNVVTNVHNVVTHVVHNIQKPSYPADISIEKSWMTDPRFEFLRWSRNLVDHVDEEKAFHWAARKFLRSWYKENCSKEGAEGGIAYKYLFAVYIRSLFRDSDKHFRSALDKLDSWNVDCRWGWTKLHSAVYNVRIDEVEEMLRKENIDAHLLHWKDLGWRDWNPDTGAYELTEGMTALERGRREHAKENIWMDCPGERATLKDILEKLEKAMAENPIQQPEGW